MKLLLYDACTFTLDDIMDVLKSHHVQCRYVLYRLTDIYQDDFFTFRMNRYLDEASYDAVFSINYYPILAEICHKRGIRYIAWSYDSPLVIPDIEETLIYPTTYFFVFDRIDYENYRRKGFQNVYHLPLGIHTSRLNVLHVQPADYERFGCDVSLLGQIYESTLPQLLLPLSEYLQGYIHAIVNAQLSVYGSYFVDSLLTASLMAQINEAYSQLGQNNISLKKHGLSAAIAKQITHIERITLLDTLGELCKTDYYAHRKEPEITHASFRGSVNYYSEMYKVFQCSKVNLNPTLRSIRSGIPLRALDILGSGGFLLSNYQPELAEYFKNESDLAMYTSLEDAVDHAMYYLSHDDIRAKIAQKGQQTAFTHFSYERQLSVLFSACGLDTSSLF